MYRRNVLADKQLQRQLQMKQRQLDLVAEADAERNGSFFLRSRARFRSFESTQSGATDDTADENADDNAEREKSADSAEVVSVSEAEIDYPSPSRTRTRTTSTSPTPTPTESPRSVRSVNINNLTNNRVRDHTNNNISYNNNGSYNNNSSNVSNSNNSNRCDRPISSPSSSYSYSSTSSQPYTLAQVRTFMWVSMLYDSCMNGWLLSQKGKEGVFSIFLIVCRTN